MKDKKKKDKQQKDFKCNYYKGGTCTIDNKECYLKKIHDDGIYFDCVKIIY